MQDIMREASRIVLDGFELGTDATVVRHPDRYMDDRGTVMWQQVMAFTRIAPEASRGSIVALRGPCCSNDNTPLIAPNSDTLHQ